MGSEQEIKRKHYKSQIFQKLQKPLDQMNSDHSQVDVRYMPCLSGDAGKQLNCVASDVVDKTTSTIIQVICQIQVNSLVTCSPMPGGLWHS